ncbi:MAG: D-glycero-beta-D-manno-heptose-7-phosphate kinase [Candidatus Omnitrophica bacterium]|nr:D-glycero-beta-D-manno-heptose-7-phosphate kinase [Candidatus Omnitrophota bacterium]
MVNMKKRLLRYIPKFKNSRILIVGDIMLDEFIWGDVSRISPEAPVPVVWVKSESFMPGGASNVANNLYALGGRVYLCGVIGPDRNGRLLTDELRKKNIDIEGVIVDNSKTTTIKTRVIAHSQQVVRIDREEVSPIENSILNPIITYVKEKILDVDAIIIEDYGKGLIVPKLLRELVSLAKKHKKIIAVDPKEEHFDYYKGVTVVTPNNNEASKASGITIKDDLSLRKVGEKLLDMFESDAVLITLGENGMCLFQKKIGPMHIPTVAQEVYDVCGAGDTVISALTIALASGASMEEAAYISNYAAGIVVGKVGVAVVGYSELMRRISKFNRLKS